MKMKNEKLLLTLFLILTFIITACQPRIYGQRKHRKDRNCGCEYVQPCDTTFLCQHETEYHQ